MTLTERINSYLENGGLFNPEMMEHEKVGCLLIDCREAVRERDEAMAEKDATIARLQAELEVAQRDFVCNLSQEDYDNLVRDAMITRKQPIDAAEGGL